MMPKPQARTTLTDKGIEALKPQLGKRRHVFDSIVPGLCVRVTDRGSKSFVLVTHYKGKQKWLTLGHPGILKLADARDQARDAILKSKRGENPAEKPEPLPEHDAFANVTVEFVEKHAKPNNRSWRETERIFEKYVHPAWRDRPIDSIRRRDVIDLIDVIASNNGGVMANRVLAAIRKLMNWCVERDILEVSPASNIKGPAKEIQRERVLSDDEITMLWNAADGMAYPWGTFLKLLMVTGQRRNEVAKLRWSDIDLENRLWTLPRELTKADRTHEIPLSALAVDIVEAIPRFTSDFVFPSRMSDDRPISGFSKAKIRASKLSGVTDWRLHDIRRSVATGMARLGVAVLTISRVLNHKQGGVTALYDRYSYLDEKRHALETWGSKLARLVQPTTDDTIVDISEARQ